MRVHLYVDFFSINTTVLCGPWLVEFEDVELTIGRENPRILVSIASPGTSPLLIQGWDNCVYNFQCSLSLPVYTSHKLVLIFSLKDFFVNISLNCVW